MSTTSKYTPTTDSIKKLVEHYLFEDKGLNFSNVVLSLEENLSVHVLNDTKNPTVGLSEGYQVCGRYDVIFTGNIRDLDEGDLEKITYMIRSIVDELRRSFVINDAHITAFYNHEECHSYVMYGDMVEFKKLKVEGDDVGWIKKLS